jgi:hypothetical protein
VKENIEIIDQTGDPMRGNPARDFKQIPDDYFQDIVGPTGAVVRSDTNGTLTARQTFTFRYGGNTYPATTVFEHKITVTDGSVSVETTVIEE